ncbi:hypothetical protein [Paenibacillus psychroresistens]|uniref:hypothetical protein n=1 Tax=Paenibacillus psychroresistens TaxID=1778678 RepID=UPI0012DA6E97|nr:hypothetical protein [Paenibacillus psychroresistens]
MDIFISSAMAGYALPNYQGKNAHQQRHCQEELVPRLYFKAIIPSTPILFILTSDFSLTDYT